MLTDFKIWQAVSARTGLAVELDAPLKKPRGQALQH